MGWQTEAVICICVKSIGPGFLVATLHFVIRGLVTQDSEWQVTSIIAFLCPHYDTFSLSLSSYADINRLPAARITEEYL